MSMPERYLGDGVFAVRPHKGMVLLVRRAGTDEEKARPIMITQTDMMQIKELMNLPEFATSA